ncbi:Uma2 family endonuclease [Euhalothece natronophila Z-M001]|uniref:Uma2 family endonuclease n=1 Tax=Euhalothece natronophila Z-M001 TaxID=522448 RepID=A0A5B8NQZ0_9CHRO|nr:Uma2 family endonuclease [Euhalothece natronophila]QDZ41494.1 Uma2 family endonuclease [Euhalothece natronophila Z-M001]
MKVKIKPEQFETIALLNEDKALELNANQELEVMAPIGGTAGRKNRRITQQLGIWSDQYGGESFDSSTIFLLPNGARRSPDASWISQSRWDTLTPEQQDGFPPIAPDFVVELRSPSDQLSTLQAKMMEYLDNGVRLGWLINPQDQQVEIYRQGREKEVLHQPQIVDGEAVLPDFQLSLENIFD